MLFSVEMWERFNYYGMRAILALFMTKALGFDKATSTQIFGWFTAFVYLTPLLGGYLADRFIGKRRSITIGALIMIAGQYTLALYDIIPAKIALMAGLTLIIIGNGFFKPNISSIVGDLYEPNDKRRDRGFTIFYMGINLGSFIGPIVCGALGQGISWKYGFMAAGTGMILGLITYLSLQKHFLGNIGLKPAVKQSEFSNQPLTKIEKDRIKAIFVLIAFSVFFWCFFEQAGTSLNYFADEATRLPVWDIFGWKIQIQSSFFQSINPMFVLLLAPMFSLLWKKLNKREPSIPNKFGWGLLLQGIAFTIIAIAASIYINGGKAQVSMLFLVATYFFCTTGELCLSPIGLSMITRLSPAKYVSLMMGVWFASSSLGNLFAGQLASFYDRWTLSHLFALPAIMSILFAITMFIMTKKIKTWMHETEY
jgi:POT family proton-dependent oligopeptide transporter